MKIRADIAELLHAGYSDRAVARQLGVDAKKTVAQARATLGIPKAKPGYKPAATAEDLFWRRAKPTDDGHMEWTGSRSTSGGAPSLRHGGRNLSAYRLAYRIANGRAPEGHALPSCGRDGCVKPGHHSDRADRAEARKVDHLYAAIFGTQPAPDDTEHCVHDRAVHARHHHQPVTGCPWCGATETPRPERKQLIYLSTPCAVCTHPYNWHVGGVCQFDNEVDRCGCIAFATETQQDGAQQPGLRERHRAAWNALTPEQQAARLAELDADDEQDGEQP